MTKLVLTFFAAATIAAPALAAPAHPFSFERDGTRYVATITEQGGAKLIEGREVASNRTFSLRVEKGQVSGLYDGMPVSYAAPKVTTVMTASN